MKAAKKIFLTVHAPAPGAAPEMVVVDLVRPEVLFGRRPEPAASHVRAAARLLGAPTLGFRGAREVALRRQDGLGLPRPRHVHSLFFFTHV